MLFLPDGITRLPEPYIIFIPGATWEQFIEFASEDISCELIGGTIVVHSPASLEHEQIFQWLLIFFNRFLKATESGSVIGSRFVMKIDSNWAPEPDLFIIRPEKENLFKDTYFDGPADLIIEILSKSTRKTDLEDKLPKYLTSGVNEIWIIDPDNGTITVHSKTSSKEYRTGESFQSGFSAQLTFKVEWLWNRNKYDPLEVLEDILSP
ncbi:MAG: Uma2 family endonuclease [Candidatus Odinarchaeota archaeon]